MRLSKLIRYFEADGTPTDDGIRDIAHRRAVSSGGGGGTVDAVSNVATSRILGRVTAGSGDSEELTAAQVRTLLNVADGATANASDASLRDRATHTGTQAAGTITGLATVATSGSASDLDSGTLPAARFDDTAHGTRAGGTLHAAATTSVAGFMSGADKTKLDGIRPVLAYVKSADETRVSSTAYTTDTHMVTGTLDTDSTYEFVLMFLMTGDTAQDLRFRVDRSGLSDADLRFTQAVTSVPATPITWGSNTNVNLAGSALRQLHMRGVLITGTDPGTLSIGWGQQVSGAPTEVTTMRKGSYIKLEKLT